MKKTRDTKFGTMQLKRYESDKDIDVYTGPLSRFRTVNF